MLEVVEILKELSTPTFLPGALGNLTFTTQAPLTLQYLIVTVACQEHAHG